MRAQYHAAPGAGASCPGLSLHDTPERAGRLSELFGATRGARSAARAAWSLADEPERTHSTKDGPAVAPFEPKDSYCPVGQTCDLACAEGFAGFDAAKNCKNANTGYCCK